MNIPMVDIKKQFLEVKDEVYREWGNVFEKMQLMLGENVRAFEEEFSSYCGCRYGIGVNSGTDALVLSIHALIPEGSTGVITPSFTFFATPESIVLTNNIPIFVDIEPETLTIDPEKLSSFLSTLERNREGHPVYKGITIKAIIPVHLFGNPARMDRIIEISREYNLKIIEDSAQSHGAEYKGKKTGGLGDASAFSFYMSKNLSAIGDAGMITTNNEELAENMRRLRIHGQTEKYRHEDIGYNSRLDEIQAVVLRAKLKRLEKWNKRRNDIARIYLDELKELPIELPHILHNSKQVWHMFWVKCRERDKLLEYLRKNGIGAAVHYTLPCHLQKPMKDYPVVTTMEITEETSQNILCIPIHQHMEDKEVFYVIEKLRKFYK